MTNVKLKKRSEGFTIIEVLIVLAIAGLIMLIVFLAVPALQRNSRNTQRKADVSAMLGAWAEFVNNNNGTSPTAITQVSGSDFAATNGTYNATTNPGTPFKMGYFNTLTSVPVQATVPTLSQTAPIAIITGATCNGNTPATGASGRNVAVYYLIEPGTTAQCQSS